MTSHYQIWRMLSLAMLTLALIAFITSYWTAILFYAGLVLLLLSASTALMTDGATSTEIRRGVRALMADRKEAR